MATASAPTELSPLVLDTELTATVIDNSKAVDKAELSARYILELLADRNLLSVGAPRNSGGGLLEMARIIRELSRHDLSVAFSVWAHRMSIEYLKASGTGFALDLAAQLEQAQRPGVTGMAGAFKEAAGCGEIDLAAQPVAGGIRVNGKLRWASNLYEDAVIVTAARTEAGEQLLIALGAETPGVTLGAPFTLLGLNATASAWVSFEDVFIPEEQILTREFTEFIRAVRPTFVTLQISECLGLAEAAIAAAAQRLTGVNEVFAGDVAEETEKIAALIARQEAIAVRVNVEGAQPVTPVELLELRLESARAAVAATALEVRVAGGAGYAKSSPTSRRFREASFIPVQSPSESQLKWELARARELQGANA